MRFHITTWIATLPYQPGWQWDAWLGHFVWGPFAGIFLMWIYNWRKQVKIDNLTREIRLLELERQKIGGGENSQ